ncbi:unnamed protein product [Mytilus coruscus]|uniref:CCHC-type domain-containing protein n=1 Tax=Mytilus coruscus TaxID=42192 RepID=A0A6J8EU84_MYTCO|nr:unnamed protein product [Mytilus coruscus]
MHSAEIENEFETPRLTAQGRTLLVPLQQEPDHAARGSRYEFWSQKAMDNAQGDSGSTRHAMASCESETQRGRLDIGQRKSINNAIQVAYEYEAFQDDRRKHGTKLVCAVNENNNFGPNREIDLSGQIDDTLDCLAKIENNEKNKKTFSCYHCGVSGHLKRECPVLNNRSQRFQDNGPINPFPRKMADQMTAPGNY